MLYADRADVAPYCAGIDGHVADVCRVRRPLGALVETDLKGGTAAQRDECNIGAHVVPKRVGQIAEAVVANGDREPHRRDRRVVKRLQGCKSR